MFYMFHVMCNNVYIIIIKIILIAFKIYPYLCNMYKFKTQIFDRIDKTAGCRAEPGCLVICNVDRLKKFTKGLYYKVEQIQEREYFCGAFKLKIQGIDGFVAASNFKLPSEQEVNRNKNLESLLGEENSIATTQQTTQRKIDIVDDKNYQLFELIFNRLSRDKNRLKYDKEYSDFNTLVKSISDGDRIFGVEPEDFNQIRNITIEEIFNLFINKRKK